MRMVEYSILTIVSKSCYVLCVSVCACMCTISHSLTTFFPSPTTIGEKNSLATARCLHWLSHIVLFSVLNACESALL